MKRLTREQILNAVNLARKAINVEGWGGSVVVSAMAEDEREQLDKELRHNPDSWDGIKARVAALCLVDDLGNRLFTLDDVKVLARKGAAELDQVYQLACELSGLKPALHKKLAKAPPKQE